MYVGVVVGTWLAVVIIGWDTYDVVGAATLVAILIGGPYWVFAASSLGLGSMIFESRTER
jgi:hypothetical protein